MRESGMDSISQVLLVWTVAQKYYVVMICMDLCNMPVLNNEVSQLIL